jgi:hypothetical protein
MLKGMQQIAPHASTGGVLWLLLRSHMTILEDRLPQLFHVMHPLIGQFDGVPAACM